MFNTTRAWNVSASRHYQIKKVSRSAREALKLSAEKSGVKLGELLKDEKGVPCPVLGNYWSLSHKPKCVAVVVSKDKAGIDIEEMKPQTESLFAYVAGDEEWRLKEKSWDTFFRYWTAKEATLKIIGIDISVLKACRIISVPDESHIILDYRDRLFQVEQVRCKNHIIPVLKDDNEIDWIILQDFKP